MLSSSRVSVIVPTYNRAPLVVRALRSIGGQSQQPGEIVVVDDGSTDETEATIRGEFPHVVYLQQPHRGVSAARNRGIAAAQGEWLAFLDSDDEWRPDKLERQLAALVEQPDYLLCHTDEIWIRNGRRVNPRAKHEKSGGWIFRRCLPLCVISPSSVLIHQSVFEEVGPFDEELPACEDYDLWLRVCARFPVLFVDEPLVVKYGGHADQLSRTTWGLDRFRIRALEKIVATGTLSPDDQAAALHVLLEKVEIYLQGAQKRGRSEDVEAYEQKRTVYAPLLAARE